MNVLFLTEGTTVPAARFRVGQFVPHFEAKGIRCTVRAAYGDHYNRISRTPLDVPYRVTKRAARVLKSLDAGRFDAVFLQRPAFPFWSLPELLVHGLNDKTIFDFDDSIFLDADGQERARARAFDEVVAAVRQNIAGNRWLADRAGHPEKIRVIPTVIDTDRYVPRSRRDEERVVIGWMGTRSNFASLDTVAPVIRSVLDAHPQTCFRVVSNAPYPTLADHPRFEFIAWSADREIQLLQSFDIGLMPLPDNPLTRGKCGFKMIQYMAVGSAVIASPTGANAEIFAGSDAGFLARTDDEWRISLEHLIAAPNDRNDAGSSARAHVEDRYSVRSVIPKYLDVFERIAE